MVPPPNIAAVILAAGQGLRLGGDRPKQYQHIGGEPLLRHTVRAFISYGKISPIILVFPVGGKQALDIALGDLGQHVIAVEGGATRQQSALLGLRALQTFSPDYVHIHDGARPFVSHRLLDALVCSLTPQNGVIPGLSVTDTLKKIDAQGDIVATLDRHGIYQAQTPQSFPFATILAAHEKAALEQFPKSVKRFSDKNCGENKELEQISDSIESHSALTQHQNFTDDAAVAEWYGLKLRLIEGEAENIKITKMHDLEQANQKLKHLSCKWDQFLDKKCGEKQTIETQMSDSIKSHSALKEHNDVFPDIRTGHGYDVHILVPGSHITLCGVAIAHHLTLSGHSDADVALHALTDALLATLGAGDIGTHFPPTDPQWRGVASHIFVTHALSLIRAQKGRIANIDISLIAEAPKIAPHREAMVSFLSTLLGLEPQRISVKATTNERLGFIGRDEGIAALATATILYPGSVPENQPSRLNFNIGERP